MDLFRTVQEKFSDTFAQDRTHNLIVRLRHNVIRTGLRNISISYSRISLPDVAKKLRLNSENPVADAESIVAKAIRDGAIGATIDHRNGYMVSKETGDIYSTNEPQTAFNSRIAFLPTRTRRKRAMRRGERGSSKRKSWLSIWLRKTMMISRERSSVRTLFLAAHNLTFLLCPSF